MNKIFNYNIFIFQLLFFNKKTMKEEKILRNIIKGSIKNVAIDFFKN